MKAMQGGEQTIARPTSRWLIFVVAFAFGLIISGAAGGAIALRSYTAPPTPVVPIVAELEPTPEVAATPVPDAVMISALVLPPPPPPPEATSAFSTGHVTSPTGAERTTVRLLGLK
jgi:hypothetical protein